MSWNSRFLAVRDAIFRCAWAFSGVFGGAQEFKKEIFAPERRGGWVRGTGRRRQPAWPSFGDFEVSVSASGSNRGRPGRQAEIVENLPSDGGIFDSGQYTHPAAAARTFQKVGGTVNHVSSRATVLDGFGGLYRFGSLADLFGGRPDSFRQAFGDSGTKFAVTSYGAFVQDHLSPLPRVTVDLGLRYDFEQLPA